MTNPEEPTERRIHPRYRLNGRALIILNPGNICSSKIINVSAGGLALGYKRNGRRPMQTGTLDLLIPDFVHAFQLRTVSYTTIYDYPDPIRTSGDNSSPRIHGLAFQELNSEQRTHVSNLLNLHSEKGIHRNFLGR